MLVMLILLDGDRSTRKSSKSTIVFVCVCVFFPFILDIKFVGLTAGVTQEEGHTRFLNPSRDKNQGTHRRRKVD